jgi:hypothetical protein
LFAGRFGTKSRVGRSFPSPQAMVLMSFGSFLDLCVSSFSAAQLSGETTKWASYLPLGRLQALLHFDALYKCTISRSARVLRVMISARLTSNELMIPRRVLRV